MGIEKRQWYVSMCMHPKEFKYPRRHLRPFVILHALFFCVVIVTRSWSKRRPRHSGLTAGTRLWGRGAPIKGVKIVPLVQLHAHPPKWEGLTFLLRKRKESQSAIFCIHPFSFFCAAWNVGGFSLFVVRIRVFDSGERDNLEQYKKTWAKRHFLTSYMRLSPRP